MEYQIFISYRRVGGDALAYLIYEKLSSMGYNLFYDIKSLTGGEFDQKLFKIIDECSDVIVVLSPHGLDNCNNKKDWLRLEIAYAIKTKKNIIPLIMNGFKWPKILPNDINELKKFNGIPISFEFFDGVANKIRKSLALEKNGNSIKKGSTYLKHVLIWGDFDDGILEKIVLKLDLASQYYIEILDEPVEILSKCMDNIDSIIFIVTDVTKLSNNEYTLERINQTLVNYVRKGGKLVCTHDIIYRRTRNVRLQMMFGCTITEFRHSSVVKYKKTDICKNNKLFDGLKDGFELHDEEICWGRLADDVDVYFETEDGIPLVFVREYGKGVCIYMNSGDYKVSPPTSILRPEDPFIALIKSIIKYEY